MKLSERWRFRGRRRSAGILAIVGGFLSAIAAVEIFLRLFSPQPLSLSYFSPLGLTLHIPGADVRYARSEFDHRVRINSFGLRDDEHGLTKPAGVTRILILGDSFAEGKQVRLEETFPKQLESMLRGQSANRGWEVVNGGVSGYGTAEEIKFFELYGRAFEPQIVILAFFVGNDLEDNRNSPFFRWHDGRLEERPVRAPSPIELLVDRIKEYGASHFHLWQFLRDRYHTIYARRSPRGGELPSVGEEVPWPDTESRQEEDWKLTEALLDRLHASVRKANARLLIAAIPDRTQVDDEERAKANHAALRPGDRDADQRRLAAFVRSRSIPFVDLLGPLREAHRQERTYFRIDGHFNARGHAVAAHEIFNALLSNEMVGEYPTESTTGTG